MGIELTDEFFPVLESAMDSIFDELDSATGQNAALIQARAVKGIRSQLRNWKPLSEKTISRK